MLEGLVLLCSCQQSKSKAVSSRSALLGLAIPATSSAAVPVNPAGRQLSPFVTSGFSLVRPDTPSPSWVLALHKP